MQYGAIITGQFSAKFSQKTHCSLPIRVRYGMSFVDLISDLYPAPITAVMSCYIGRIIIALNRIVKKPCTEGGSTNLFANYYDIMMGVMASQITSLTIVYSNVQSGIDQRKHQSSASLAFVWGIHRWLVNSPHKGPVTWKMFPFDHVIMQFMKMSYTAWPHGWAIGWVFIDSILCSH